MFLVIYFFLNATVAAEIYTLSLHDALPISPAESTVAITTLRPSHGIVARNRTRGNRASSRCSDRITLDCGAGPQDRKSTRLNSSHMSISYAVYCLKKKKANTSKVIFFKRPE